MRVHTVEYWERQLLAEEKNADKNNIRGKDPQNEEELANSKLAEFNVAQYEKNRQMKLVA